MKKISFKISHGRSPPPAQAHRHQGAVSILFIEKGHLDVLDGAFVVVNKSGVRAHIPVGGVACLMLEPGTWTSHAAVALDDTLRLKVVRKRYAMPFSEEPPRNMVLNGRRIITTRATGARATFPTAAVHPRQNSIAFPTRVGTNCRKTL